MVGRGRGAELEAPCVFVRDEVLQVEVELVARGEPTGDPRLEPLNQLLTHVQV